MGFLGKYDGTDRVDLGDGYWVDVKKCLTRAEADLAERALTQINVSQGETGPAKAGARVDLVSQHNELVVASVVAWNLDDENSVVLPLEPDSAKRASIARLPAPVFDELLKVVVENNKPRSAQDRAAFPARSEGGGSAGEDHGRDDREVLG